MEIIQYEHEYNKKVNEFICSIFVEEFEFECHRKEILNEDNSKYKKNGGNFWIALDEERNVIGTICLMKKTHGIGELKRLYVSPKHRGDGIAHSLYNELLQFAKNNGITRIELGTYNKLKAAVKFYIKKGFKQIQKNFEEDDAIFFVLENV